MFVEQRYQAVLEVLNDGATVTDVARRNGVSRQVCGMNHDLLSAMATTVGDGVLAASWSPRSAVVVFVATHGHADVVRFPGPVPR